MCQAYKVIQIAKSQVGYLEKASNKHLDEFEANAGRANYTKYARDYAKFAGVDYQGQAWCDMFVDWCFVQAYGRDKARELLGGFAAYTPTSAQYFKDHEQWHTSDPQPGDVIFFKNSSRINHTGIVTEVTKDRVHTVEGNTSGGVDVVANGGGVWMKSYALYNSKIAGYGRPAYVKKSDRDYVAGLYRELLDREPDAAGAAGWVSALQGGASRESVREAFLASEEYKRLHGGPGEPAEGEVEMMKDLTRGDKDYGEIATLQRCLKSLGYYDGKIDHSFGAGTEAAVKAFQSAKGIAVNYPGTVGPKTWTVLLTQC